MISDDIAVFLNGSLVRAPAGATLGELVLTADPPLGAALAAGEARATDARGIASDPSTVLVAGAIFRVFRSARTTGAAPDA